MNIGGMIQGMKQKVRDREERKAVAVSAEYDRLKVESKMLKARAEVYRSRIREK